ncbi:PAS domain-containing protein [Bradyrhizobium manausense]|uniref:PAS domain-containing protein n=1 Tax=Bradyrhizobium TaxID=374 RepID=UPI001BA6ADB0|nr:MULTISPECIES: PAS domain-containing protein [Bradyrhizobium]MBR0825689.1 PAS domain-containing protein [Bradyrhizobium manausense]UVO31362.1 PAS domain-containing protein [Bradyrhizobium arachidis]
MLDLLKRGTEETFGVIERELRCGLWSWNLRTNEMEWSRGYYDLLGIEPGKVTPSFSAILQVTHPDDRGPQAEVERVIRKASTIRRKFRIIRRGGSVAWIYCQIIVFVDPEGAAEKAVGICTDITAREDQLNQLRVADERYRALVKATGAVVWSAKSDGRIHEVTNCDESGNLQAVALESGWLQLIHPDDRDKIIRVREEASRAKRSYDVVHRVLRTDGTFKWKRSTGQPLLDDAGNVKEWLGVSLDLERDTTVGTHHITGAQIRAARGLLRWSVLDLAHAARVTRATIRRLEELDGASSHKDPALPSIESALSKAGVEFLFPEVGKPGVRPR